MLPRLTAAHRSWPLTAPFRISRGVKTSADVVTVTIRDGEHTGHGEAVPYARYGETVASVIAQVESTGAAIAARISRRQLQDLLPPGAARNAIDCALWDLEAQRGRVSVARLLGRTPLHPLCSAQTISLDSPERMARAAAEVAHLELLKIKVAADDPASLIRAVRASAPQARLIVDPNESWTLDLLQAMQPVLAEARVDLVEQPLPAGEDEALQDFHSATRLCADESCHTIDDLPRLRGRYQVVNIKLDKTGGLTAALDLLDAARTQDFGVMVGCMICSSLGIAPALQVARDAEFVDLDGPLWLQDDHPGGAVLRQGLLQPPAPALWGGGLAPTPGIGGAVAGAVRTGNAP
ncbi:MAG: N-acetyl-D-Glu racemase DgcA [Luteimonas sp.]